MTSWSREDGAFRGRRILAGLLVFGAGAFLMTGTGCAGDPAAGVGEICGNAVDDDGDGGIDCADTECSILPICANAGTGPSDLPGGDTTGDSGSCGREREACCPGNDCDSGLVCTGGRCVPDDGECGGERLACCPGDECDSGLACLRGRCAACGGTGQPCCEGETCDRGLSCDGARCVVGDERECGGNREPCCEDSQCDAGYACARGTCAPCGDEGTPCCASNRCDRGLTCQRSTCIDDPSSSSSTSSSATCSRSTSCGACIGQDGCGWCRESNRCMAGSFVGPDDGSCSWFEWDYMDCPATTTGGRDSCSSHTDCESCLTADGCGFCDATNTCMAGDYLGPSTGSCDWMDWDYMGCGGTDDGTGGTAACGSAYDCASCIEIDGCGWCDASSTCMSGGFTGPDSGACDWMDWDYVDCEATDDGGGDDPGVEPAYCGGAYDCATCLEIDGCGWCASSYTCMSGGFTGPDSGACDWTDWDYMNC